MALTVRTCQFEDLPYVGVMFSDLYNDQDKSIENEGGLLVDRLSEFFMVAEFDGRIVGFIVGARGPVDAIGLEMAREAFPDVSGYLEVQDLYVAPDHRNKGIGSLLMTNILKRGREAGLTHSMVYSSNVDYQRIGRFYEKFGYRIDHLFMKR
jgi:GNAT superfamily N-acetyltransferase